MVRMDKKQRTTGMVASSPWAACTTLLELKQAIVPENQEMRAWIELEIEVTLVITLRKALVPHLGLALLPTLSSVRLRGKIKQIPGGLPSLILLSSSSEVGCQRHAPLTLCTMSALLYVNKTFLSYGLQMKEK